MEFMIDFLKELYSLVHLGNLHWRKFYMSDGSEGRYVALDFQIIYLFYDETWTC